MGILHCKKALFIENVKENPSPTNSGIVQGKGIA